MAEEGITRRMLLSGGAATLIALLAPDLQADQRAARVPTLSKKVDLLMRKYGLMIDRHEFPIVSEFATLYGKTLIQGQENPSRTSILYPGSGEDINPVLIGLALLHTTPVETINYVATEIGPMKNEYWEDNHWHTGFTSLRETVSLHLKRFEIEGLLANRRTEHQPRQTYTLSGARKLPVTAVRHAFDVPTPLGSKQLTFTLSYNQSPNRSELTESEEPLREIMGKARGFYWPTQERMETGKTYPTYATQRQFEEADIIISHQCGDFNLLQFDYLRAIFSTQRRKQRAVLMEHPLRALALNHRIPGISAEVKELTGDSYGDYTFNSDDKLKVGVLVLRQT